jgi:hypothetical protein
MQGVDENACGHSSSLGFKKKRACAPFRLRSSTGRIDYLPQNYLKLTLTA